MYCESVNLSGPATAAVESTSGATMMRALSIDMIVFLVLWSVTDVWLSVDQSSN
jgi:hypothetical protein